MEDEQGDVQFEICQDSVRARVHDSEQQKYPKRLTPVHLYAKM
jgi:hypothetical protein